MTSASSQQPENSSTSKRSNLKKILQRIGPVATIVGAMIVAGLITWNVSLMNDQLRQIGRRSQSDDFWTICNKGESPESRSEAFLRLVNAGHSEWRSGVLQGLELQHTAMENANLARVNLAESDLTKSDLTNADLSTADLSLVDFTTATLKNAMLREANLFKAIFDGTDLREASLASASITQCTATDAQLVLCDLTECDMLMSEFRDSNFAGANLTSANLEGAKLINCNLSLARLTDAILLDTDFTDSNWWRARGIPPDVLERLRDEFPPSASNPARQNDYRKWLEQPTSRVGSGSPDK